MKTTKPTEMEPLRVEKNKRIKLGTADAEDVVEPFVLTAEHEQAEQHKKY